MGFFKTHQVDRFNPPELLKPWWMTIPSGLGEELERVAVRTACATGTFAHLHCFLWVEKRGGFPWLLLATLWYFSIAIENHHAGYINELNGHFP